MLYGGEVNFKISMKRFPFFHEVVEVLMMEIFLCSFTVKIGGGFIGKGACLLWGIVHFVDLEQ